MIKPEILFLKQEHVIEAGLLDMKQILQVTEETFRLLGEGKVRQPTKIFMGMPNDDNWESYGMSMPAYIGGDVNICGFKWAAESVSNPSKGLPYGIDVVILRPQYHVSQSHFGRYHDDSHAHKCGGGRLRQVLRAQRQQNRHAGRCRRYRAHHAYEYS